MSSLAEFRYSPDTGAQNGASWNQINVDGESMDLLTTNDFPVDDPWSEHYRRAVAALWRQTFISGIPLIELGVGDARNIVVARGIRGRPLSEIHGVDIDAWRLNLAAGNLELTGISEQTPVGLYHMHALDFLGQWMSKFGTNSMNGTVLMCLPQSPEGENNADSYNQNGLGQYQSWDLYGLSLNAAVLDKLHGVAHKEALALVMLSGRVPQKIRQEMFRTTGWSIEQEFSSYPVVQDPDTGIHYVQNYAEDGVFWEVDSFGNYQLISTDEAIRRWDACHQLDGRREDLNVLHTLHTYLVSPKKGWF